MPKDIGESIYFELNQKHYKITVLRAASYSAEIAVAEIKGTSR
jgi:hypothetical protein